MTNEKICALTATDRPRSDPSQVFGTGQRNIRHGPLLVLAESHLHWLRDSFLRNHFSLHSRSLAMLHVLYRLDIVASCLLTRHNP